MLSNEYALTKVVGKITQEDGSCMPVTFVRGKSIGKGAESECFEFLCEENKLVFACKVIQKRGIFCTFTSEREKQKIVGEVIIHKSLNH
jgi:hypothetical protein